MGKLKVQSSWVSHMEHQSHGKKCLLETINTCVRRKNAIKYLSAFLKYLLCWGHDCAGILSLSHYCVCACRGCCVGALAPHPPLEWSLVAPHWLRCQWCCFQCLSQTLSCSPSHWSCRIPHWWALQVGAGAWPRVGWKENDTIHCLFYSQTGWKSPGGHEDWSSVRARLSGVCCSISQMGTMRLRREWPTVPGCFSFFFFC